MTRLPTDDTSSSWAVVANPIPAIQGVEGREMVQIEDCGEPLVSVSQLLPGRLRVFPEYYLQGFSAASLEAYVRLTVGSMLARVAANLPSDLCLLVLDAWRPISLQRQLFEDERLRQRTLDPTATDKELDARTSTYVSLPSDEPRMPPPHLTGGAVDVTLAADDGKCLAMGTSFDHFGPEAATRYFEDLAERGGSLGTDERLCCERRRLLYHHMIGVGFANYKEEWWHFDYGNQFWAIQNNTLAIYGASSTPSR